MAPTKKGKKHAQQLEEEAMAEWLARGHRIKDFTMDKMLAIWLEEDGEDGEDDGEDGGTLGAKEELMKGLSILEPIVEQAKEYAEKIKETVKEEAAHVIKTAIYYAEIPPLKRRRLLREHVVHVHEMDSESTKYERVRVRVRDEWENAQAAEKELAFGLKKRNARKAPLLSRTREMKEEADREQHARLLEDIERKRRERMDAELGEKQRQRQAREEFADAQRVYRRTMNMKFWQKQYVDAKQYADHHSLAVESERVARVVENVERINAEIAQMNGEEDADGARPFERTVTTSSVGVFGTALEPGEWHSSVDGGDREGLDDHTVGLFTSPGFETEHELLRIECMEAESKVASIQEKLALLDQVRANLLEDRKMILRHKDKVVMDMKQVSAEHDDLNRLLAGPPRRDPSEDDKLQFHTLVTRRAAYMKQLHDLNAREASFQKRSELALRSEQNLRLMLQKDQERMIALQCKLGDIDRRQTDLPVVIGRSIQREAGVIGIPEEIEIDAQVTAPLVNPAKLYADVTLASRFKLLENAASPVKEHYKKAKQLMIEDWKTKEFKSLGEHELEVTKNRLSRIRDRMIDHQRDSLRADLMQAITRFHEGPMKLRKCIFPLKGHFAWWQTHDPSRSIGLNVDEGLSVICLDPHVHSGQLRGCVRLPKACFYRIDLSFRLHRLSSTSDPEQKDLRTTQLANGDEEDIVKQASEKFVFYIGPDYDSLQEHVFRDVGGEPIHVGDVSFEFYGARLCYSFDATHRIGVRPQDAPYRLAIKNSALYEERIQDFREEESRMRLVQKEAHVLSELVKTLRMQTKKTSSERSADLLTELVAVETSKAKTWDSTLLHGHQQRFDRLAYASMLRLEIKKELARQIDEDVHRRKCRLQISNESSVDALAAADPNEGRVAGKTQRRDASRMEFLARKYALVEPQYIKSKRSLGEYCSFKLPEEGDIIHNTKKNKSQKHPAILGSYRKESIVMGLRFEWREGKTKLHVMHKLYESRALDAQSSNPARQVQPQWCVVEHANAVFLASACAKALKVSRDEEAKARQLMKKKDEQVQQLQEETKLTLQEEQDAQHRETIEDELLRKQKENELRRRGKVFYADAIRNTTYNERVSSQIDFLAHRKQNGLLQGDEDVQANWKDVLREVKEDYARKFVDGRLALVRKTWERKEKRIQDQRDKDRRERAFRIHQEQQLVGAIHSSQAEELGVLQRDRAQRVKDQLIIPHFERAVLGAFLCEHRLLKAWGSKYDSGVRCKSCGKEMSKSFDDPDHQRGADPQLDRDVEQHRSQVTGGKAMRLRDASHFERVEQERLRVEKEAREIELSDALLYDRMDPTPIEEFNYRHNMNRHPDAIEGSDPLYQRSVQESHHAAFQDELLYHGRLKNYHFRIHQLTEMHTHTTTMIAVQHDFLQSVQEENAFVLAKLPLVERDHARAVRLVEEDDAALKALQAARKELDSTRLRRERAYYAMEGVEEEAEFAEFHAPSLIESSGVMSMIVARMQAELAEILIHADAATSLLETAEQSYKKSDRVLARLYCRERGARLRTRFGFCRVLHYREEDHCVVVSPERWEATIYISVEEIVSLESADRQAEATMLDSEDNQMHAFLRDERRRELAEAKLLAAEERDIHEIVNWQAKKVVEETLVRSTLCDDELAHQLEYEMEKRKETIKAAAEEAKKMHHYTRVSLTRRKLQGKGPAAGSSRLDILRVTRACEKRLAMASMEQALLQKDQSLRRTFQQERDAIFVDTLRAAVFDTALHNIIQELCTESLEEEVYDTHQSHRVRNQGLAGTRSRESTPTSPMEERSVILGTEIRLERLWLARRQKVVVLHATWQKEHHKVLALRQELARRDEIRRQQEAERRLLETRRKEMLAEERQCRKFYLEEMVQCMKERKELANAEMEMREYLRQLELEAMRVKYAAMLDERNKTNDKAARRLEIKLGKNEQHRLHREWAQIKIEDELATRVRDDELTRAQAEALEQLAERFLLQQVAEGKLIAEREAARVAERIQEAQRAAAESRAAFEAKLVQERMMATVEAFHLITSLELQWMNAVERSAFWKHKTDQLKANLVPMQVELKRILAEKDHVVADAQAKRSYAEQCKQHAREADVALRLALQKEEACTSQFKKIRSLNATMDSEVLHDRPQRFRTRYLRDQLHTRYFYLLTESIIRHAIVKCNEREAERLDVKRTQLEQERAFKIKEIGVLKRRRRRQFHMQLKRSELGKKLFGLSQRRALKERFQQWVKLWSQRVMVRASFEVKHGVLLQQHRLDQQHAQLKKEDISTKLSILHQHQKRRVRCRLCKAEYTEDQNHRYACSYHPGAYELACAKSCPTRQPGRVEAASTTAATCMLHRARRWLCCDETDEGRYGSNGCARRFHLPQRANPALAQLVEKKEREEESLLTHVQKQLDELKERNVLGKVKQATKTSVGNMEQLLAAKRAVAAKYHVLDRR